MVERDRRVQKEQERQTRHALKALGIKDSSSVAPAEVPKIDRFFTRPDLVHNLRVPYATEVLGPPGAGKSTFIERYLSELWLRGERHTVALVNEGARSVKERGFGDLRETDPFMFHALAGSATFLNYIDSLKHVNTGMRMAVADRGQIDRRVFRRVQHAQGLINSAIIAGEQEFIEGFENTPIQMGVVIMLLVRPEQTMRRRGGEPGPVCNMEVLPKLYEQYLRLHWELLEGKIPYRIYACIDAEKDMDEVYERFKYAMDTALNLHTIYGAALAQAFPTEYDKVLELVRQGKLPRQSHAQKVLGRETGKRVLIVGGDEMESEDDILGNSSIEGIRLK